MTRKCRVAAGHPCTGIKCATHAVCFPHAAKISDLSPPKSRKLMRRMWRIKA